MSNEICVIYEIERAKAAMSTKSDSLAAADRVVDEFLDMQDRNIASAPRVLGSAVFCIQKGCQLIYDRINGKPYRQCIHNNERQRCIIAANTESAGLSADNVDSGDREIQLRRERLGDDLLGSIGHSAIESLRKGLST